MPPRRSEPNQPGKTSRPPMERMLRIHQEISAGKFPNATKLATVFEMSSKTIQRDIDFMRDRLNLPLVYNLHKMGYEYSEPVSSFPTLQITEGELVALLVAEKAMQQYRGTRFEQPLYSGLKKLAEQLPDTISFSLQDWDQTISFRTRAEPILNLDVFDAVTRAAAQRKQIQFSYRKPGQQATEQRVVDPYHLANINGEWFLFGYDHARGDIRTFVPARMSDLQETGKTFARPEKFSIERRLHDSFGVVSGSEKFEVVIRFNRYAADFIREKRWHPSQELREIGDGELEMKMKLSGLDEVQRWILSWGGHARPMQPPRLVEMVQQAAQAILKPEDRSIARNKVTPASKQGSAKRVGARGQ